MNTETEQRIEETLTYQDKQIQDLSDMILAQGKDITALKKHIRTLEDNIRELEEDRDGQEGDEGLSVSDIAARDKPPHY